MPWLLGALTAQQATRWAQHPALRRFGAGATPAVIGLLGVTALTLTREAMVGAPHMLIGAGALLLLAVTRIHPVALLVGAKSPNHVEKVGTFERARSRRTGPTTFAMSDVSSMWASGRIAA